MDYLHSNVYFLVFKAYMNNLALIEICTLTDADACHAASCD